MFTFRWHRFIEATKNRKPVGFLIEAVERLSSAGGLALDLGCGAGVDAKYLAENGFLVEAVDLDKNSIIQTRNICRGLPVKIIQKDIFDYNVKIDNYSLIISWNTLSFLDKEKAKNVLINIQEGLKTDGLFVFGLFGPEDDWAEKHSEMSFWTAEELKEILSRMEFVKILEEKQKKPGATGEIKFWHLIQGIAKKNEVKT